MLGCVTCSPARLLSPWRRRAREALALYPALGAIWGAWIGALVIPLDWDRPWQAYPNPCVVGACVGHSAGHLGLVAAGSSRWSQHHKLR